MVKEIQLTRDKVALVDDGDYDRLNAFCWCAHNNPKQQLWYAKRGTRNNGRFCQTTEWMHHYILPKIIGYITDHINGNGLDNQKSNLRLVTRRGNAQNMHITKTSMYPGAYWERSRSRWMSRITVNNTCKFIGRFDSEYDAYIAYRIACISITGRDSVGMV